MKDWDEPWKKKEPEGRLTEKERALQQKSQIERAQMDRKATQKVRVTCFKKLWAQSYYHQVQLNLKIPLSFEEIMKRMHKAFPELPERWEGERA